MPPKKNLRSQFIHYYSEVIKNIYIYIFLLYKLILLFNKYDSDSKDVYNV